MIEQENRAEIRNDQEIGPRQFSNTIVRLISPADGEVTLPLQKYPWPEEKKGIFTILSENGIAAAKWKQFLQENDRSIPRAVLFSWEVPNGNKHCLNYDLDIARDPQFSQKIVAMRGLVQPRATIYNLEIGVPYYWKVAARLIPEEPGQDAPFAESHAGHFITNSTPPRWIYVPGVTNVRDIGGWSLPGGRRVLQGLIYRGSEMNSHCSITPEGRSVLVEDLGIRTDLDLRGVVGEDANPVLDPKKVEHVNISVLPYDSIASPEFTGRYREVFRLLATRSRYPFFIHCWGGADRTGTVIFLILALLGVSIEDLSTEYELTSLSVWGERLRGSEAFLDLVQTLELFAPKGSSIQAQVERYMNVIGVTREEVDRIREIMTE